MPALRRGQNGPTRLFGLAVPGLPFGAEQFVLPRALRRPVRFLSRLVHGDVSVPRYANATLNAAFLAAAVAYGVLAGGHAPQLVQAITAHSGFAVDAVRVTGHRETSEIDILDRLELTGWTSLIGYSVEAARERVATLPWIERVAIRKVYPDALEVQVEERQAFAIWQQESALSLIEASGRVIAPYVGGRHAELPLVTGIGAERAAGAFLAEVRARPALAGRVKAFIRVGDRRWDLRLDNGVTVKLPEEGEGAALDALVAMERDDAILSRDIVAIDLRLPDRVVVKLTPEALERRTAAIAAAEKAARKRPERRI